MKDTIAIVLAAGRGTRMNSRTPKVLHDILGKPMIHHVLDSVRQAGVNDIVVIAGHGSALLKRSLPDARVLVQKELLGSGDAVNTARKALGRYTGDLLVVCGDTPLLRGDTLRELIRTRKSSGASAVVLTTDLKDPTGYGRIVRDENGAVIKIIEELEAGLYEKVIEEINVGSYCFRAEDLFDALTGVKPDNDKKEYFLTDVIAVMNRKKKTVKALKTDDTDEAIGVNTKNDLAEATRIMKGRVMSELMLGGVTIYDPSSTTIYPGVRIGADTVIYPNTIIESDVEIGKNASIGPFARLRPGVRLEDNVEVGNFVELVRTEIGEGTKVKHHTYLGDAKVGKNVNIGAGTITANFDGSKKQRTVIGDGAFLGIGTRLIAPVRIGSHAVTGAGSVVPKNRDVPSGATVVGVPARILGIAKKKRVRR